MIKNIVGKVFLPVLLAALLPVCPVMAGEAEEGAFDPLDYLGQELEDTAKLLLDEGEDIGDIYTELHWNSVADTFPTRFDLRERGTVTPVESQEPWGTCWSFATIAASETSILNSLGMTTETYREKYDEELDLSEKHLAWFTAKALPELDEYPEGEYPYEASQAGEGLHPMEEEDELPLDGGGNYFLSTSSLANGIGILKEAYAPYTDSEGTLNRQGDWSLPEKDRFTLSFEVKDVNILPAPAARDEDGNYVYRASATEAIKTELLAGRAVAISLKSDRSRPEVPPEELKEGYLSDLERDTTLTDEEKEFYADVRSGVKDMAEVTRDELGELILIRLRLNSMPEDTYDLESLDHDQLAEILNSRFFGDSYDLIYEQDHKEPYMTFIGSDPVVYAQYTYEPVRTSHGVTVVGWDDTFKAENWPEDRRPPADGVWIVKNSWGTGWGTEGYFLLSYYDKTLCALGSFEYVVSEDNRKMDRLNICSYDYMPAEIISSTLFERPVYTGNIFTMEEDSVLEYVSTMTGDLDAVVTASVYLLDEDAKDPADGILLDSITDTFRFAGYHRMTLNDSLLLPKGSRIGIVVMENVPATDGSKYALVNTGSLNEAGAKAFNELHEAERLSLGRYAKAIVNEGESFVSFEPDSWMDWTEAIASFGNRGSNACIAYDNLPIKAYVYPLTEVEKVHDLSQRVPTVGGEAAICPEDGYTLLDIAGNGE